MAGSPAIADAVCLGGTVFFTAVLSTHFTTFLTLLYGCLRGWCRSQRHGLPPKAVRKVRVRSGAAAN